MVKNPRCPNCIMKNRKGESEGHAILRKDGTCPKCGKKYPIDENRRKENTPTVRISSSNKGNSVLPVIQGLGSKVKSKIYGFPKNDDEVAKIRGLNPTDQAEVDDGDRRELKFLIIAFIVVLLAMGFNTLSLLGGSLILFLIGIFGLSYLIFKT